MVWCGTYASQGKQQMQLGEQTHHSVHILYSAAWWTKKVYRIYSSWASPAWIWPALRDDKLTDDKILTLSFSWEVTKKWQKFRKPYKYGVAGRRPPHPPSFFPVVHTRKVGYNCFRTSWKRATFYSYSIFVLLTAEKPCADRSDQPLSESFTRFDQ